MAISMLKIRRPLGRLIFNTGIAIPGKTVFLIEMAPWSRPVFSLVELSSAVYVSNIDIIVIQIVELPYFPAVYWEAQKAKPILVPLYYISKIRWDRTLHGE